MGKDVERNWVFLPPGYRLPALALSTAVVALVVWDKARPPSEFAVPHVGWEGDKVALKTAAEAPFSQMDLSGRLAARGAADRAIRRGAASTRRWETAPGKPVEVADEIAEASKTRSEEERSAINERLYKGLEQEKKRMGIAKIIALDVKPEALLARVLVLKNAETLQTAWAAAGLAGDPPAVDFPKQMALFLACPPGCGIVSVRTGKRFLTVLYGDSGFENESARVRAVPASSKPTVLMLAP